MNIQESIRLRSEAIKELGAIILVGGVFLAVALATDAGKMIETLQDSFTPLNEILLTLALAGGLFSFFAFRRWRDLQKEVAARQRMEEQLRASQTQLANAQRVAQLGSWEWNPATNAVTWSDALFRLFGFRPQEFAPTLDDYVALIHPDDRDWVMQTVNQTLEEKGSFNYSHRIVRPDGMVRILHARGETVTDETGSVINMIGTAQDITERRKLEEALQESEERFRQLAENIEAVFWLYDLREMEFLYVSPAYEIMWGRSRKAVYGNWLAFLKAVHPEDREHVRKMIQHNQLEENKYRIVRPDESIRWVRSRTFAVRDASDEIYRLVGIAEDITERKRYEQQLQQANVTLDRSVKELERRNREIGLLGDLTEMLQSCAKEAEAYEIIGRYVPRLFPASSGALYIISASRNIIEVVAEWGESTSDGGVHAPNECWALRRGRPYLVTDPATEIVCRHVDESSPGQTLCVPMMAQGEALGILHVSHLGEVVRRRQTAERPLAALKHMSVTLADHIALSVSNLKLRQRLQDQALRDPLTGLFNRRYMEESFERELRRAEHHASPLGVIMIDLDHFKKFNDMHGHAAGDAVLRKMGAFLRTYSRGEDIACRYGGEEFTLIFPDAALDDTRRRAEELRRAFKHLDVQYRDQTLGTVTLSLGTAAYPDHGGTIDQLLRAADTALYRAKAQGRDRVVVARAKDDTGDA